MFFAAVVCSVDPPSFLDEVELLLSFSAFQQVEPYGIRWCALGDRSFLDQSVRRGVVTDSWRFGLWIDHFFQGDA